MTAIRKLHKFLVGELERHVSAAEEALDTLRRTRTPRLWFKLTIILIRDGKDHEGRPVPEQLVEHIREGTLRGVLRKTEKQYPNAWGIRNISVATVTESNPVWIDIPHYEWRSLQ